MDRLRLAPLQEAGLTHIGDLLGRTENDLRRIPGMGTASARAILGALKQLRTSSEEDIRFRISLDRSDDDADRLLGALARYRGTRQAVAPVRDTAEGLNRTLPSALRDARPAAWGARWLFTRGETRQRAQAALDSLAAAVAGTQGDVSDRFDTAERRLAEPPSDHWREFETRSADFYAWLSELVPLGTEEAARGHLDADLAARIEQIALDDRFRTVSLRGYQSFGAKFAIAQRRVLLADEMGLGKTIQALAALAHVAAEAPFGTPPAFLVLCPATLMSNWARETAARTTLPAVLIHGDDRQDEVGAWLRQGGVGITSYETVQRLELPHDLRLAVLVVDEAHYAKNPRARRSIAVNALALRAARVVFLTGTPMENTVEEFETLAHMLQPDLVVPGGARTLGATAFRRRMAPVYLRRNAEDVLLELPERIESEDWVDYTEDDVRAYRSAVREGNFMAMRRAGFHSGDGRRCGKAERLEEIVAEATANGRKVVVFSFFRDLVETLARSLAATGATVIGPLSGAVGLERRQALLDQFAAAQGPAVLVAQIQAGGVGLNIQAASVVVLCEPQLVPTTEEQAIARVHRMGQVRTVNVHRLLNPDGVDEQLRALLAAKAEEFDAYARRSYLAETTEAAVDVVDESLAARIVRDERARLALDDGPVGESPT